MLTSDKRYTKFLLLFDRRDCGNMIAIKTGRSPVTAEWSWQSEDCRKFLEQCTRETSFVDCPALTILFFKHLGVPRYATLVEVS